ncbi:MAG TPA: hypothetical protein VGE74_25445 [Gemmata sp.]
MARRITPLAVALVLLVGCGKNRTGPTSSAEGASPPDPGAAFTLKIREEQQGDKLAVTTVSTGTIEGGSGKEAFKLPEDSAAEYTETVLEMPAGAAQPTKLIRAYRNATKYDLATKGPKPLAYQGKTVTIEKKGTGYTFTVDGKDLDPLSASELKQEFGPSDKKGAVQDLLPKRAVKVGESWAVNPEAVKDLLSELPFGIDTGKSKMTGTLVRAYTQDGKPWGRIAFAFDLVIDPTPVEGSKGGTASGTVKIVAALDAVTDGSAPDGVMKMAVRVNVTSQEAGKETKITSDTVRTRTIKSVK